MAIDWYTKNTCLYRILNQMFRQENVIGMFQLRYFIKDLYLQLKDLHTNYINSLLPENKSLTTYRGQFITINQVEQLKENINGLIYMNTFLSTTTDRDVGLIYAGADGNKHPYLVSVIFKIEIDTSIISKPFTNINEFSYHKDENEVLFALGSVFKIKSVKNKEIIIYGW
ncbi:unnamed protein product [Didymodactylos carnosus]|uniref:ADP ribosyltransferase domain-containing protein n=1 Tax=Didymodactylos carnosus TaxID=1234261 RepID=A0A8S2IEG3_9BILA|nr:unnamed protein product [Didymodactylos carnosus]CAF3748312.1 unnamed protein product [Didymodactylos carnosus]